MPLALEYLDSVHVNMHDGYYDWIDSARFAIDGASTGTAPGHVLALLLRDDHYVNAYDYEDTVASRVHGTVRSDPATAAALVGRQTSGTLTPFEIEVRRQHPAMWTRWTNTGPVHGPYAMSCIDVTTFDLISGPAARDALLQWVTRPDGQLPPAENNGGDLAGILRHLEAAPTVYRLHDLEDEAQHDHAMGPMLELITVDLHARQLRLITAGDD